MRQPMGRKELLDRLASRFEHPRYALFSELGYVGVGSGRMDAMAMAMWRSLGLEVHGFEIKISRSDWLREIKQPHKADEFFQYCNRWWLCVADQAIVKNGELPPKWGLLVPHAQGLKAVVEAQALKPEPLDRAFVAEILRHAYKADKQSVRWEQRFKSTPEELQSSARSIEHSITNIERRLSHLQYGLQAVREELAKTVPAGDAA